jgi:hypothetical protein
MQVGEPLDLSTRFEEADENVEEEMTSEKVEALKCLLVRVAKLVGDASSYDAGYFHVGPRYECLDALKDCVEEPSLKMVRLRRSCSLSLPAQAHLSLWLQLIPSIHPACFR